MSRCDSISITVKRKTIQDTRREIPAYADPIYRPPPKANETPFQDIPRKLMDLDSDVFPISQGVTSEMYQRTHRSYFQEPPEWESHVSTGKLVQKFLPQQADIDKILKIIQKRF